MSNVPDHNNPDVQHTPHIRYGKIRRRTEIGKRRGSVEWFIVQLEENLNPGYEEEDNWQQRAGFDHHPKADWGHDIRREGLHMDLYDRNGEKQAVKRGFSDVPLNVAPAFCEQFFDKHGSDIISNFPHWCDLP